MNSIQPIQFFEKTRELTTQSGRRESIIELVDTLKSLPVETHYPDTARHVFSDGVYAREFFIAKGALVVGKIHCVEHLNIVHGHCVFATEDGVERIDGHRNFSSRPGIQKAIFALEDTIWTTIHVTNETDHEKIAEKVTVENYNDFPLLEDLE